MRRFTWIFFALAVAALATPVREIPRDEPFRLQRAVACRGQEDGLPVDPGREFAAGERSLYVWFAGRSGTRPTPLEAVVSRDVPPRVVAVRQLSVPSGSDGGLVSLALESRQPLPAGAYRVTLRGGGRALTVEFAIVAATAVREPARLDRLSDGFSLVPRPGWQVVERDDVALVLLHVVAPAASAMVVVRHEPRPLPTADVADRIVVAMAGEGSFRVLSRAATQVAGRSAVALVIESPSGGQSKLVVVPREPSDRSRAFFGLIVSAAAADFPVIEAEFDRMLQTFRVIPPRLP